MSMTKSRVPAIRYWSSRIAWVLVFCLVALPVLVAAMLILSWTNGVEVDVWEPGPTNLSTMEPMAALFVGVVTAATFGFFIVPLYFLQQMFRSWGKGDILTRAAAGALKRAGLWVVVATIVVSVVVPILAMVFNAWFGVAVPIELSFELDGFLVGAIVYVVGLVLDEAARVAEDAELTI